MDLRAAIRSGSVENVDSALLRSNMLRELMAKNAANGAGMLMLAVQVGNVTVFEHLATVIKERVSAASTFAAAEPWTGVTLLFAYCRSWRLWAAVLCGHSRTHGAGVGGGRTYGFRWVSVCAAFMRNHEVSHQPCSLGICVLFFVLVLF